MCLRLKRICNNRNNNDAQSNDQTSNDVIVHSQAERDNLNNRGEDLFKSTCDSVSKDQQKQKQQCDDGDMNQSTSKLQGDEAEVSQLASVKIVEANTSQTTNNFEMDLGVLGIQALPSNPSNYSTPKNDPFLSSAANMSTSMNMNNPFLATNTEVKLPFASDMQIIIDSDVQKTLQLSPLMQMYSNPLYTELGSPENSVDLP